MKKVFLLFVFFSCISFSASCQEINLTNTDSIYFQALQFYKAAYYEKSLGLTIRGLQLAPQYHDIRILQIRDYWALGEMDKADTDLNYLLTNAPDYVDTKPLIISRLSKFKNPEKALVFIQKVELVYPNDLSLEISKSQYLLKAGKRKESRSLALELIKSSGLTGAQRYGLQTLLNRTVSDEIAVNYQYIHFSKDYTRNDPWQSLSTEYQHNFNRTAVIGRVNYSDRSYDQGILYELEAYPVFNDRLYAFTNIGVSDGTIFPDVRASASLFYNFAKVFEMETGGRMLFFNKKSYFTGIIGMTAYQGRFYLNARTFLGPKRLDKLVQNYQVNVRYYFKSADNYLFLRLGSGISPDERTLFSQVQENPKLNAYYGNIGINKTIGIHHIFQLGAGLLYEDITSNRRGNQLIGTVGYRYRF